MAIFVHIADERDAQAIRRNGLALPKARLRAFENERRKWGVFALPVIDDFMLSHQWVRELKRRGHRSAVGVYFASLIMSSYGLGFTIRKKRI